MRNSITTLILTAGGVATMSAALVLAAPGNHRFPISTADIEAKRTAVFTEVDSNGDGLVEFAEFEQFVPMRGHASSGFHRPPLPAGREHPMALTPEQREAFGAEVFTTLDDNGDGMLSAAEFSLEEQRQVMQQLRKRERFDQLDASVDGMLDPSEFPPDRLSGLDADQDGEITREEAKNLRSRVQ